MENPENNPALPAVDFAALFDPAEPPPTDVDNTPPPADTPDLVGDFQALGASLVTATGHRKAAEAERKLALAPFDEVVATWKARLDSVKGLEDSLRSDLLEALASLEGLQATILAQASTDPSALGRLPTIPTLPGVSFAWRKDAEIIAPDEVPREWCIPDATRIRKAALAGVQIPGVALVERRGVTVR